MLFKDDYPSNVNRLPVEKVFKSSDDDLILGSTITDNWLSGNRFTGHRWWHIMAFLKRFWRDRGWSTRRGCRHTMGLIGRDFIMCRNALTFRGSRNRSFRRRRWSMLTELHRELFHGHIHHTNRSLSQKETLNLKWQRLDAEKMWLLHEFQCLRNENA